MLQAKMEEYAANGTQLGWLIDPFEKNVYVYRPREPVKCLQDPAVISAEPVLPGFVFDLTEVWHQAPLTSICVCARCGGLSMMSAANCDHV